MGKRYASMLWGNVKTTSISQVQEIIDNSLPVLKTGWNPTVQSEIAPYFDSGLRDFGFALTGLSVDFWVLGIKFTKEAGNSAVFTDTYGRWYLYMDSTGSLTATQTPWNDGDNDKAMVGMLFWSVTLQRAIYKGFEYHSYDMPAALRFQLHKSSPEYVSGLAVTINAIDAYKIDVADGVIRDEDITANIGNGASGLFKQALQPFEGQKLYLDGTEWKDDISTPGNIAILDGSNNVCYNPVALGAGALTALSAGEFTAVWVIATMDWDNPIKILLGTQKAATAVEAAALNTRKSLDDLLSISDFPANEVLFLIAKVIVQNTGTPYTIEDVIPEIPLTNDVYVDGLNLDDNAKLTVTRTAGKEPIEVQFAKVAKTNSYNDLNDKPTIPENTDEKVKYDSGDTAAGYLSEKIVGGTNVTVSEGTGADENKLVISASGGTSYMPKQVTGKTLLSTGWTLVSGLYEYDLSDANITASSIVEVIPANADISIVKEAEILPETDSSSGSVKIYAVNQPTTDISVTINIFEATT